MEDPFQNADAWKVFEASFSSFWDEKENSLFLLSFALLQRPYLPTI
jgi:hypothetical protein